MTWEELRSALIASGQWRQSQTRGGLVHVSRAEWVGLLYPGKVYRDNGHQFWTGSAEEAAGFLLTESEVRT